MIASEMGADSGTMEEKRRIIDFSLKCQAKLVIWKKKLSIFNILLFRETERFMHSNKNSSHFRLDEIQVELDWKSEKLQEQMQINQILWVINRYLSTEFYYYYYVRNPSLKTSEASESHNS